MAENLPPLRPIDLSSGDALSAYLRATTAVCPFIEPSAAAGCLNGCDVAPDCQHAGEIHPRLFEQLVPQIERFRDARRALPAASQRLLVCHVVRVHLPAHLDADAVRLLRWPNLLAWSLKHLYTPKEVVMGFVRRGVADRSATGIDIPVAPFHAVLIRSRVAGPDRRFYTGDGPLLQAMLAADDDGGNVHGPLLGRVPDVRDPQALRDDNYYQRVLQWWQTHLAKR